MSFGDFKQSCTLPYFRLSFLYVWQLTIFFLSHLSSSGPVPTRGGGCVLTHRERADVSATATASAGSARRLEPQARAAEGCEAGANCRRQLPAPTAGAVGRGSARERGLEGLA